MFKKIAIILLALSVVPAYAITYAVPDNGAMANDCFPGYICLDSETHQTFSIGAMSFPPPWLAVATDAARAQHGILRVVETAQPAGNFASIVRSVQMVSGVPTVVWTTTPMPTPTAGQLAQQQYNAAIVAGLTITSTGSSSLNGTYSITPQAQSNISGIVTSIAAGQGLPHGALTIQWLDAAGAPHAFTALQITAFGVAIRDYLYDLQITHATLAAGGSASWPAATVTIP